MIFVAVGGVIEAKPKLIAYFQMDGWSMEECGPLDFSSRFSTSTSGCRQETGCVFLEGTMTLLRNPTSN
jgi:hypothetical protein